MTVSDSDLPQRLPPNVRSTAFRNDFMQVLQGWQEALRELPGAAEAFTVAGIDVLEVARYEWFFLVAPLVHRSWTEALEAGSRSDSSNSAPSGHWNQGRTWDLGLRKRLLANRVWDYRTLARHSLTRRVSDWGRRRVFFIENYPNSATVAAEAARKLRGVSGFDYRFFVTRKEVGAAVRPLDDVHLVHGQLSPTRRADIWSLYQAIHRTLRRLKVCGPGRPALELLNAEQLIATESALRRAAYFSVIGDALVRDGAPALVASTSGGGAFSRGLALAAQQCGIPSCLIQHGIYHYDEFERHMVHDSHAVWGRRDRDGWLRWGWSKNSITVTGSPRVAATPTHAQDTSKGPSTRVVYFPSRTDGAFVSRRDAERMLQIVLEGCKKPATASLTIKPHPGDGAPIFDTITDPLVRVERARDANAMLARADIVIASTSTVAIEACAQGKDLVLIELEGVPVHPAHREHGAALIARDAQGLATAIHDICHRSDVQVALSRGRVALVDSMFAGNPSDSAERIARALGRLASPRRPREAEPAP